MNTTEGRKRNRSANFDVDDIELLLGLVSDHTYLLDSNKFELKKQGWDAITTKFNENCVGEKRDLNALKLKIKNLKAISKKIKCEVRDSATPDPLSENHSVHNGISEGETADGDEYSNTMDNSGNESIDTKPIISNNNSSIMNNSKIRKRCKKFTPEEQDLLVLLHEKHCGHLDTSSTPNSVKKRNNAWENLTADYNQQQATGIVRECNELKIKIKNMKALRTVQLKTEPVEEPERIMGNSHMINESEFPTSKEETKVITPRSIRSLRNELNSSKDYEEIAHSTAVNNSYYDNDDYEEDFQQGNSKEAEVTAVNVEDKEIEKIRRENVLLKNSVLRKKERLLELQIALAENNLRRSL